MGKNNKHHQISHNQVFFFFFSATAHNCINSHGKALFKSAVIQKKKGNSYQCTSIID